MIRFYNGKPTISSGDGEFNYWREGSPVVSLLDGPEGVMSIHMDIAGISKIYVLGTFNILGFARIQGVSSPIRRRAVIF